MFDYYGLDERIGIYLDYSNMHYTKYALGREYDIWNFISACLDDKRITKFAFYGAYDPKNARQFNWVQKLKNKFKDERTYFYFKKLETKGGKNKGNVDTEMGFDIGQDCLNNDWDCIILFTGDGDFLYPIKKVLAQGKKISVVSTKPYIAKELINFINDQDVNICRYINLHRDNEFTLPIKTVLKDSTRGIALYPPLEEWIQDSNEQQLVEFKDWIVAAKENRVSEAKTPEFLKQDGFTRNIILRWHNEEKEALIQYLENIL